MLTRRVDFRRCRVRAPPDEESEGVRKPTVILSIKVRGFSVHQSEIEGQYTVVKPFLHLCLPPPVRKRAPTVLCVGSKEPLSSLARPAFFHFCSKVLFWALLAGSP